MIRNFTHKASERLLLVFALLFAAGMTYAQTPIAEEDFSGGMPAGWTSEDLSGGAAEWTWCDDPAQAIGDGCVVNWGTYSNQHDGIFASTSGSNGFVLMDSDALQQQPTNHEAVLTTTAFDFSAADEVWVKYESLIGVFGLPTLDNCLLRVSTDATNWTDFNFVDIPLGAAGNPGVERWTINPEITVLDVSSVAANQATVYFQFFWRGNWEYYWLLDDMQIYDEDPSLLFFPANDVRVDNFFAIYPNAQTPAGQEVPMSFLADVSNQGLFDAPGVELSVTVNDGTSDVFTDNFSYGMIGIDSVAENQSFANTFTPSGPAGTVYTGTYSISMDSTDEISDNDTQQFTFMISDSTYAKEMGPTRGVVPAAGNWDAGEALSWGYGNHFYVPNGAGQYARYVTFGINNADELLGQIAFLKLYKWDNEPGDFDAAPTERTELANTIYQITGTEVANELITIPFTDLGGQPLDIELEDGGNYIVAMEFSAPNDLVTINMASSDDFDYTAQVFQDQQDMEANPIMATMIVVNDPISTEAYEQGGFGDGLVPCLRMSIGQPLSTASKELLSEVEVTLTPNPAVDYVQLQLNLEEMATDLKGSIINMDGKIIRTFEFGTAQNLTETITVGDLPAGNYLFHLSNDSVFATRQFIVVK